MNVCREIILRGSVVLCALAALAAAPVEPVVSVNVYENTVRVKVQDDHGKPIVGYRLRLRDRAKNVIAEGQSNADGQWEYFQPRAGKYEVVWGSKEHGPPAEVRYDAALPPTGLSACCLTGAARAAALPPRPSPPLLGIMLGLFLVLVGLSGLIVRAGRRGDGFAPPAEDAAPATDAPKACSSGRLCSGLQVTVLLLLIVGGLGTMLWAVAPPRTGSAESVAASSGTTPATAADAPGIIDGNPNLAEGARADLRKRKVEPLSGALDRLLSKTDWERIRSQALPLLTSEAPEFELLDAGGHKRRLKDQLEKGPVVLVFYYGYFCDHCVSQLFGLQADIKYFHDLGAEVVAISPDTPEITRERYKEYGAFDFPVLCDPDNKIAQAYGVFVPPESDSEALAASGASAIAIAGAPLATDPLLAASALFPDRPRRERVQFHGTFVIDREGRVQWGYEDNKPFTSNRTLLYKLAELEDKLPTKDN